MQRQPTPTPRKNPPETGLPFLVLFAVLCVAVLVMLAAFWPSGDERRSRIDADDGDPYFVTPVATVPAPELRLELALPPLSDIQYRYAKAAETIPYCPRCHALDFPQIAFTDSERAVFVALLFTESNLMPYDEAGNLKVSEAGCVGIAQLCGDLLSLDARDNQDLAIYVAADYFKQLLDEEGGDLTAALRRYKGIATEDTHWQADVVLGYLRLRS